VFFNARSVIVPPKYDKRDLYPDVILTVDYNHRAIEKWRIEKKNEYGGVQNSITP
jgi:hypothetical protein